MEAERVLLSIEGGIARVTLNRPEKHNGLDMPMFHAIDRTIKTIAKNAAIRVVIVHGAGESFSSGMDFNSVMPNPLNAVRLTWKLRPWRANLVQRVSYGWRMLRVPVIMVLHGYCWGGGMQIALGGDFRFAHPETSLAIMEAKFGLVPDMGGTPALRENLPTDQAMLLAMSGEPISAKQALYMQLITGIELDPMQRANALAEIFLQRDPKTLASVKKLYQQAAYKSDGRILLHETFEGLKAVLRLARKKKAS